MKHPIFASNSFSELGEGLALGPDGTVAWLDINSDKIFVFRHGVEQCFPLNYKASVIFRVTDYALEFGSEAGIHTLDLVSGEERCAINAPREKRIFLRSNDGCYLDGGRYLMGFMHPSEPSINPGQIFYFCGEAWHLIDDQIAIPNTFLNISKDEFLISDSLLSIVWKYQIGMNGRLVDKTAWMEFENGAPDGGCIYDGHALIAIWDGGCVSRINLLSKERTDYQMPIPRPTNCAVDPHSSSLWVTSAREGLDSEALKKFPLSGKTLSFEGVL